jgi:hypothetical protein
MTYRYNYVVGETIAEVLMKVGEWQQKQGGGRLVSIIWDTAGSPTGAYIPPVYVAIVEEETS